MSDLTGRLEPALSGRYASSESSARAGWRRVVDESTRRFLVFRTGLTGFPDSELEVVTNWRRTVVDPLSGSGR